MNKFKLVTEMKPMGSQPEAIKQLAEGFKAGEKCQTLLGVTGSGKSLDYSMPLFLRNKDGYIIKIKIGKFVEDNLKNPKKITGCEYQKITGYNILSFNIENYKIEEKKIKEISKHKEDYIYEIILDDNSYIKVTKFHNCYRLDNCKLELCKTSELKIGDYLPTSNCIIEPYRNIQYINLLDFNPKNKININRLIKKFDSNYNKKTLEFFKKEFKNTRWNLNHILNTIKERGITTSQLYKFLSYMNFEIKDVNSYIKIISEKEDVTSPLIKINKNFLIFTGLYLSRGHNTKKDILISNSNQNLQKQCKLFYKSLGLKYKKRNKKDIKYHSKILCNFYQIFGCNTLDKKIPNFIYNLSNTHLSIFLRILFDCDGWVEQNSVNFLSSSKELIYDLKNLLLRFGINSRITFKKMKKKYYELSITGMENLLLYQKCISFSIVYKKEKLLKTIKKNANTNVDVFPNCSMFLKNIRIKYNLYQKDLSEIIGCSRSYISMLEYGIRKPSKKKILKLIECLYKKNKKYESLLCLINFNFRKIVKIRKLKNSNVNVYDVSVENNENFLSGYGNIFVHNTFTMANIIEKIQKPTLVLAHNKTLAAQLYSEFKEFFPENRVEYFVSYYDYYQPESYIPSKDQYIEKDADINPKIEQMRLAATASVLSRMDVIVVASVSCIYTVGDPIDFVDLGYEVRKGNMIERCELLDRLINMQYERNDLSLAPGRFRVKGETIDLVPGYYDNIIRIEFFDDEIDKITELDKITGEILDDLDYIFIYPAKHFVIGEEKRKRAVKSIKEELEKRILELDMIEAHRLKQRTLYDIEMIEETGFCKGIENYSRHFDGRKAGEKPFCFLDYFTNDFLMFIDESHRTIPQIHGMNHGDYSRKKSLIDYGFRLPSAYDNRPLTFEEFRGYMKNVIFVSATPGDYELGISSKIVEQIIRPTGLVDPSIEIRSTKGQIHNLITEINNTINRGERVLVTTLTKRLAEELSEFLAEKDIKTRYLHAEIDTLERTEIIRQLRLGNFDVLVGINLLREGIDIPEVGFIGILDADKEGFLRDHRSLIQIMGRAARNVNSKVVLYADNKTDSIQKAIEETNRRRNLQITYNKKHNITPKTIVKPIKEKVVDVKDVKHIPKKDIPKMILELELEMRDAADNLNFEKAIFLRDKINRLKMQIDFKR
jgi:excinuclease ABC subunit B